MMKNRRILIEALLGAALSAGAIALSIELDFFEFYYHFSRGHDLLLLDEVLLGIPLVAILLAVFALRRMRDLRQEMGLRLAAEAEAIAEHNAREQFMVIMCHELRTPLNGIIGTLSYLAAEDLTPDQKELAQLAQQRGKDLGKLIEDVLAFSRMERDGLADRTAEFAPGPVVLSVHRMLQPVARGKGLDMPEPEVAGLPEAVVGVESAVRHVLLNLASNAVKFTDQGQVRIAASYHPSGAREGILRLEVSDTGPGIPVQDHTVIFEPYRQLDRTRAKRRGGIGLGLSLVKRMVDALGGSITLASEPGRGTTFTATLPVSIAHQP